MPPIGKEATDFVRACKAIHAVLARGGESSRKVILKRSRERYIYSAGGKPVVRTLKTSVS